MPSSLIKERPIQKASFDDWRELKSYSSGNVYCILVNELSGESAERHAWIVFLVRLIFSKIWAARSESILRFKSGGDTTL